MDSEGMSKKRLTDKQLTKDNCSQEDEAEESSGSFTKASAQELKNRCIRRVRRAPVENSNSDKNPFAGISLTPPTEQNYTIQQPAPSTEAEVKGTGDDQEATSEKEEDANITYQPTVSHEGEGKSVFPTPVFTMEPASLPPPILAPKPASSKEPADGEGAQDQADDTEEDNPNPPLSAEDRQQFTPISAKTGEESEETIFTNMATLYQSVDGQWKVIGRGEVKVNVNDIKQARVLLRHEGTLKLLLNARLYKEMVFVPLGDDAISFSCINAAQGDGVNSGDDGGTTSADDYKIYAIRIRGNPEEGIRVLVDALEENKANE